MNYVKSAFKVGDILYLGKFDGERIVIKVITGYQGHFLYDTLRTDPHDIKVNGKMAKYTEATLISGKTKIVGYNPIIELLYGC